MWSMGFKSLVRQVARSSPGSSHICGCRRLPTSNRLYSVWEPDDLVTEPEVPEYSALNLKMTHYDYVTLESFAKYAHNLVSSLRIDTDAFASPAQTCHIKLYKPQSTNIEHEYDLAMFERTVQIEDTPSTSLPLLIEVLQQNMPAGLILTIKEPSEKEEELRYVPDLMMQELQAQIDDIDSAKEERKRK